MAISGAQLCEKFPQWLQWVSGDPQCQIEGLNTPELASEYQLIFIADKKLLAAAQNSKSHIWVVDESLLSQTADSHYSHLMKSSNVPLAMAHTMKHFFPIDLNKKGFDGHMIHSSAIISTSAQLGQNVQIGPLAVIGENCQIEDGCIIGGNTHIEANVHIGKNSHIHPQVFIGHSTIIGQECEVHPQTSIGTEGFGYAHDEKGEMYRITHYGRVVLEDRVHIGAGVQIDRGTFGDSRIGTGTKIDNHCHFGHNINIGRNCIITGGFIAAGSVNIGDHCIFGGRTTVTGHIDIASGCQFAGLSGVSKTVDKPGKYGGYPLQALSEALKTSASLTSIPSLRKTVARISRKLGLDKEQ